MEDKALGFMREARAALLDERDVFSAHLQQTYRNIRDALLDGA